MSVRNMSASLETPSPAVNEAGFVAINFITCQDDYCSRFEELFSTRAKAIDNMPGFKNMQVLRPNKPDEPYLVVSHWSSEAEFKAWVGSEEFIEGHKRGFEDLRRAKERGEEPPMTSNFVTYDVIAR
ncbi:MAG: antibiotic biosynthesis monooxygenase [Chlorobia bacterium]|nr:antibiotic biosynthesis monooxygenase [Fimbriimonadaceae bacterium]